MTVDDEDDYGGTHGATADQDGADAANLPSGALSLYDRLADSRADGEKAERRLEALEAERAAPPEGLSVELLSLDKDTGRVRLGITDNRCGL